MMKLLLLPALAALLLLCVDAYDIGCIYPEEMPEPFEAQRRMVELVAVEAGRLGTETPIVVHAAHAATTCNTNCRASHDSYALNAWDYQRPKIVAPKFGHNAFSMTMCIASCYNLFASTASPNPFAELFEEWNLPVIGLLDGIVDISTRTALKTDDELFALAEKEGYHPMIMGILAGLDSFVNLLNDGWNALGNMRYDHETNSVVPCTANCMFYSDTTGYYPRNNPNSERMSQSQEVQGFTKDKYMVEGNDMLWQPLMDSDNAGYFSYQLHVTPHIGLEARTITDISPYRESPKPEYNYREEALQVVEELRRTASSPVRRSKIKLFDAKPLVREVVEHHVKGYLGEDYSFQSHMGFLYGLTVAEYDATILVWREKVNHDLVRPTTVIKRWGNDPLLTYNGIKQSVGPTVIKARDFEAFIRVMPHSEFPSGSACLCTSYAEFTDLFTASNYPNRGKIQEMTVGGEDGFKLNCNGEFPEVNIQVGCGKFDSYSFDNMQEFAYQCGQSRLWGGMHFTKSVPAAEDLCRGIGAQAMDLITMMENDSDWSGNAYYQGDARPVCGAGGL